MAVLYLVFQKEVKNVLNKLNKYADSFVRISHATKHPASNFI